MCSSNKVHHVVSFLQTGADGKEFKLEDPFAAELPANGFDPGEDTFQVRQQSCAYDTLPSCCQVLAAYYFVSLLCREYHKDCDVNMIKKNNNLYREALFIGSN